MNITGREPHPKPTVRKLSTGHYIAFYSPLCFEVSQNKRTAISACMEQSKEWTSALTAPVGTHEP